MKTWQQYHEELIQRGGFDFENTLSDIQIREYFVHTINLWLRDNKTREEKLKDLFGEELYEEFILAFQDSIIFCDENPILTDMANGKDVTIDSKLMIAIRKHMNKHQLYFSRTIAVLGVMEIIKT